jgi:hypothetical protein
MLWNQNIYFGSPWSPECDLQEKGGWEQLLVLAESQTFGVE